MSDRLGRNVLEMFRFVLFLCAGVLLGCAGPVKKTHSIDSNKAIEVAATRAVQMGWKGPFRTEVTETGVSIKGERWLVLIATKAGGLSRSALVYVSEKGEIIEFSGR